MYPSYYLFILVYDRHNKTKFSLKNVTIVGVLVVPSTMAIELCRKGSNVIYKYEIYMHYNFKF